MWDAGLLKVAEDIDTMVAAASGGLLDAGEDRPPAGGSGKAPTGVLAIDATADLGRISLFTAAADIYEGPRPGRGGQQSLANFGRPSRLTRVVAAHWERATGLACHPKRPEFVTVGMDRTLRVWSARLKKQIGRAALPAGAHVAAYSPCGLVLVVGHVSGVVALLAVPPPKRAATTTTAPWAPVQAWRHGGAAVTCIAWADSGTFLGVG